MKRALSRRLMTAAAVLGVAGAASAQPSANKDPIIVGVLLPLTGVYAALGNEMYNGYKLALEEFNNAGGVNGRMIQFKVVDCPTADAAVGVAGQLSTDPKVAVIMGSYSSSIAIPASAVASRNGKLYWETGAASGEVTDRGLSAVFRTNPSNTQRNYFDLHARFLSDLVAPALGKKPGDIRIGVVHEDGAFGTSGDEAFRKIAAQNGWMVVSDQSYTATTNDLSSVIISLKGAQVDVLYALSYVNDGILLMTQSKELGFKPALVWGSGAGFASPDMAKALGDGINGVVTIDGVPINAADSHFEPDLAPTYSQFVSKFQAQFGHRPLGIPTVGYQGAMVLFHDVLGKANPADQDSILAAAKAVDIPDGGTVAYSGVKFDETGQNTRAGWYMMQYANGLPVVVYPQAVASTSFKLNK